MKRNYCLISLSLLISLFIYTFFRTEKTFINEIIISIISHRKYSWLRKLVRENLSLNEHIIYSLPEGLWVFCITLTSKYLFIKICNREFNCVFAPLIFSVGLEIFQLFHFTNGRFDFWDIGSSVFFWVVANYFVKFISEKQNILNPITIRSVVCFSSYIIVYLAHVWK